MRLYLSLRTLDLKRVLNFSWIRTTTVNRTSHGSNDEKQLSTRKLRLIGNPGKGIAHYLCVSVVFYKDYVLNLYYVWRSLLLHAYGSLSSRCTYRFIIMFILLLILIFVFIHIFIYFSLILGFVHTSKGKVKKERTRTKKSRHRQKFPFYFSFALKFR